MRNVRSGIIKKVLVLRILQCRKEETKAAGAAPNTYMLGKVIDE